MRVSATRVLVVALGSTVAAYSAFILLEVVVRAIDTGEILVQPALRQRPRLPPSAYPWHMAWPIILGWVLFAASGVALVLAAVRRFERAALLVPILLLLGFICIVGATVISSISGLASYVVAVVVGVAALAGLAILSERVEHWKAKRRSKSANEA
jgi:hypothetical protein